MAYVWLQMAGEEKARRRLAVVGAARAALAAEAGAEEPEGAAVAVKAVDSHCRTAAGVGMKVGMR